MSDIPPCPECNSEYAYPDREHYACPDCGHEWIPGKESDPSADPNPAVKDAFGNPLQEGDSITIIKDLKVKGAAQALP